MKHAYNDNNYKTLIIKPVEALTIYLQTGISTILYKFSKYKYFCNIKIKNFNYAQ